MPGGDARVMISMNKTKQNETNDNSNTPHRGERGFRRPQEACGIS